MEFFEKLDELHAKELNPKKFKEVNGVSEKKVMRNVMDFVDKFDAEQVEPKKGKKELMTSVQLVAVPLDPAAAKPAAAKPKSVLSAKIAKALAAIKMRVFTRRDADGFLSDVARVAKVSKATKGPKVVKEPKGSKGGGPGMK